MPSHNLARIEIDDLEIIGYSVAGEETVVAVPQLDVCFDIGKAPDQLIHINNVLLTHGHMDHAGGTAELAVIFPDVPVGLHRDDLPLYRNLGRQGAMFGLTVEELFSAGKRADPATPHGPHRQPGP